MGSIYKITNTVNGKSYIGQTIQDAVKTRIRDHLTGNGNRILKQAIEKYGQDAFVVEILHDSILPEFLDTLEIEAIAKYNTLAPNGYNLTTGGGGGSRSEEACRKISEAMKRPEVRQKHAETMKRPEVRQKMSENNAMKRPEVRQKHAETMKRPEVRRKQSESMKGENNPMYGKTHSEETKRKISENNAMKRPEVRRKISGENSPTKRSEVRQKMSEARTGKTHSEETKRKISKKLTRPEHKPARAFFLSLPSDMDLKEKRHLLHQKISGVPKGTLNHWTREWHSELE